MTALPFSARTVHLGKEGETDSLSPPVLMSVLSANTTQENFSGSPSGSLTFILTLDSFPGVTTDSTKSDSIPETRVFLYSFEFLHKSVCA